MAELSLDELSKYEILHPCCNMPISISGTTITVRSGCDGRLIFKGPPGEFQARFAEEEVWQTEDETLPGFYTPIALRELSYRLPASPFRGER